MSNAVIHEQSALSSNASRSIAPDFIRVFACVLMIGVHIGAKPFEATRFAPVFTAFVLSCNGLFFMLSGYLNLQKEFSSAQDILVFYAKRIGSLFLPYIIITVFLTAWGLLADNGSTTAYLVIATSYHALMYGNAGTHLWFMYPLIGLTLSTPFLSVMLHALDRKQIRILFALGFLWLIVSSYLTVNLGIGFSYSGFLLGGWPLYYYLGYYVRNHLSDAHRLPLYLCGIAGFLITAVICVVRGSSFQGYTDMNILFVVYITALFAFLEHHVRSVPKTLRSVLFFIARHSYVIYMIHFRVYASLTPPFYQLDQSAHLLRYLLRLFITFFISLGIALPFNYLVFFPAQRMIDKAIIAFHQKRET